MMLDRLLEVYGHLGAALAQSIDSDDQIIMGHVRDAHFVIQSAIKDARRLADEKKVLQDKLSDIGKLYQYNAKTLLMNRSKWMYLVSDIQKILED